MLTLITFSVWQILDVCDETFDISLGVSLLLQALVNLMEKL